MRHPIVPAALIVAGVLATSAARSQPAPAEQPKKYRSVEAEVVSANVDAMTLTVKVAGQEQTYRVSPLARTRLSQVKAGDKVILSLKDVDDHKEVVAIRPSKAASGK